MTDTVTIGATYAPKRPGKTGARNRTFLGGGMYQDVSYRAHDGIERKCWCMTWWEWAGEEVQP